MGRKPETGHMAGNVNVPISCLAADKLKTIQEKVLKDTGYQIGMKAILTKIILDYKTR